MISWAKVWEVCTSWHPSYSHCTIPSAPAHKTCSCGCVQISSIPSLLHKHNEYPAAIPVAHQPVACGSLSRCAVCLKQGYQWLKDKILSEEGRRQQAKLKELQAIAERLGCTLPQLAIGNTVQALLLSLFLSVCLSACLELRTGRVSSSPFCPVSCCMGSCVGNLGSVKYLFLFLNFVNQSEAFPFTVLMPWDTVWLINMTLLNYAGKFILPGPCLKFLKVVSALNVLLKVIVHPKMKFTPWFTHPQAMVYIT